LARGRERDVPAARQALWRPRPGEAPRAPVDLRRDLEPAGRMDVRGTAESVGPLRRSPARGRPRPVLVAKFRPDRAGAQPEHDGLHLVGGAGGELELQLLTREHEPGGDADDPATDYDAGEEARRLHGD